MEKIKSYCAFIAQSNVKYPVFIAGFVLHLVSALNAILNRSIISMNLKKMFAFQTAKLSILWQSIVKTVIKQ